MDHLLSVIIFVPLLGVAALYTAPSPRAQSRVAVLTTAIVLALVCVAAARFDWRSGALQLEERASWIPTLGASYHVGVDGLSLPLIALTALLFLLAVIYSGAKGEHLREMFAVYLVLETGLLGTFATLDLLLFYLFWELALVPMYFLIGVWGHARRAEAAMKFFLYTRVGSLAILLSILALWLGVTPHTFDLPAIVAAHPFAAAPRAASWVFFGLLFGFAIKLPIVPLHSWLPDAHTEAPTGGSVILAGLLLKMGGYGLLRIALPVLPDAARAWAPALAALAVISALYGAAVAMAQTDLKRLVALTSVNHMGYVLIGVAAAAASVSAADRDAAATGATYQLVAHGLVTGGMFFAVGMIADRTGTREIAKLRGLWSSMPGIATFFALLAFASMGLPGLAHFAAEVQILLGTLGPFRWAAAGMIAAMVIMTALLVWTLQRILFGEPSEPSQRYARASVRERIAAITLVVLAVVAGLAPASLARAMELAHRRTAPPEHGVASASSASGDAIDAR
jgi:NADH-quinone oxidoreductase subunit M